MILFLAIAITSLPHMSVLDAKCESLVNPLNVDVAKPMLSWMVDSRESGQRQSGYQIIVSRSLDSLDHHKGDLWDSGKVLSDQTLEVPYGGKPLKSCEKVYWQIRAWDKNGAPTDWTAAQSWTMGLLNQSDWHASWIGATDRPNQLKSATILLRKTFDIKKHIKRVLCFATGLGQYEMWLNGHKVGIQWLTPGWTQYSKTVLVDAYDVTSMLQMGTNSVAMHIGNGMYDMSEDKRGGQQLNTLGPKKALCQLEVEYQDGAKDQVVTDGTWRWSTSPETYSGVFGGEDWDARKEQPGWKLANFNDHTWKPVSSEEPPTGKLRGLSRANPHILMKKVVDQSNPSHPKPNLVVYDLRQNAPYVPFITVTGARGTTIRLYPAEKLNSDGTVDQRTMRSGKYVSYTLSGNGYETWHPSFWYVGSQFWQAEATDPQGKPIEPESVLKFFQGAMIHADIPEVGTFQCSSELLNRTRDLISWSMRSNFASVISDCPHREKSGWLEQIFLMGNSMMYSYDMSVMFRKVISDIRDTQQIDGMVPTMAPEYFHYDGGFRDSVEWSGAYLFLPQMMRDWYGKLDLVGQHYPTMKAYVDYLGTKAKDNILSNGLGDWNGYGADPRTPVAITDTAYYYKLTDLLRSFAHSLGKKADEVQYAALGQRIKESFQNAFLDRNTGKVGTGSQSAQATALDLGLINQEDISKCFEQLVSDVAAQGYTVSCGEVGHPSLLRVLTRFGRADLVAKIHLQSDRPGYGYMIKKGLTSLAEAWDARPISYNHFMLGHIMEWLYGDLAGIQPDPSGVAFSKIIIRPQVVPGIDWAQASYKSPRGLIYSSWRKTANKFHMTCTVPANTTATIFVPAHAGSLIRIRHEGERSLNVFVSNHSQDGFESISVSSGMIEIDSLK